MNINSNNTLDYSKTPKKSKKIINRIKHYRIALILISSIIAIICVPFFINELYKVGEGYLTVWSGNDVLAYAGTIISAIGTIVLGIIAWKQNARLLKLEESSFVAANSATSLLVEAKLSGIKSVVGHLGFHEEQIVYSSDILNAEGPLGEYRTMELTCKFMPLDDLQHIALVNVKSVRLVATLYDKERSLFELLNTENNYTRVAISKKYDSFTIVIVMTETEKQEFVSTIDHRNSTIEVSLELSMVTNKFAKTDLLCRTNLKNPDYDENEGIYSDFKTSNDEPPICFWKGTNIISSKNIRIKQLMGGTTNGEDEDAE